MPSARGPLGLPLAHSPNKLLHSTDDGQSPLCCIGGLSGSRMRKQVRCGERARSPQDCGSRLNDFSSQGACILQKDQRNGQCYSRVMGFHGCSRNTFPPTPKYLPWRLGSPPLPSSTTTRVGLALVLLLMVPTQTWQLYQATPWLGSAAFPRIPSLFPRRVATREIPVGDCGGWGWK